MDIISKSVAFIGPLPPPSILEGYEACFPGLATRIVTMAEQEQKNRHEVQLKKIDLPHQYAMRGQLLGFAGLMVMIGFATYLFTQGHNEGGLLLLGATSFAVVGVFVKSRFYPEQKEASPPPPPPKPKRRR